MIKVRGFRAVLPLYLIMMASLGQSDMLSLPIYLNAQQIESFNGARNHHPIIASAMKKVNGIVKADEAQYLDGELVRKLYLLPDETSHFPAYDFYVKFFQSQGVKEVYRCQRVHCGNSNFWANNVFKIPTLYGLNSEQAYFIGKKVVDGHITYFSVYTVRSGNRRSYVLVDVFKSDKKPEPSSMVTEDSYAELLKVGYLFLPADNGAKASERIKRILSNHNDSGKAILIILTTKIDVSSVEAFDRIQDQAKQWINKFKQSLVKLGINQDQFRLIYGGTHERQPVNYQLKVVPLK